MGPGFDPLARYVAKNMGVYLVVVHDTVIQSREYAVFARNEEDAKEKVKKGQFITESEPTVMDHDGESIAISSERIGTPDAS